MTIMLNPPATLTHPEGCDPAWCRVKRADDGWPEGWHRAGVDVVRVKFGDLAEVSCSWSADTGAWGDEAVHLLIRNLQGVEGPGMETELSPDEARALARLLIAAANDVDLNRARQPELT